MTDAFSLSGSLNLGCGSPPLVSPIGGSPKRTDPEARGRSPRPAAGSSSVHFSGGDGHHELTDTEERDSHCQRNGKFSTSVKFPENEERRNTRAPRSLAQSSQNGRNVKTIAWESPARDGCHQVNQGRKSCKSSNSTGVAKSHPAEFGLDLGSRPRRDRHRRRCAGVLLFSHLQSVLRPRSVLDDGQ
jgi:hypothetical protein